MDEKARHETIRDMGSVFSTVAVVLVTSAALYRLRRRFLRSHHNRVRRRAEQTGWPLTVASLFALLLGVASSLTSITARGVLMLPGSVLLALGASIDLSCGTTLARRP